MKKEFGIGEYTTRNGFKATVCFISKKSNGYPLIGYVEAPNGVAGEQSWSLKGQVRIGGESVYDLVQEPATIWVNQYADGFIGNYPTPKDATANATQNAIRTAVEFREVIK